MNRTRRNQQSGPLRSASGMSGLELVCTLVVLIPVALFAVNIGYLGLATFTNDAACREAARAAAQQTSAEAAYGAALAAAQSFKIAGGLAGSPQVVQLRFQSFPNPDEPDIPLEMRDLRRTPTNNISMAPFVRVTTRLNVGVPAPMFIGPNGISSNIDLVSRYSFPVLNGIDSDPDDDDVLGPLDDPEDDGGSGEDQADD